VVWAGGPRKKKKEKRDPPCGGTESRSRSKSTLGPRTNVGKRGGYKTFGTHGSEVRNGFGIKKGKKGGGTKSFLKKSLPLWIYKCEENTLCSWGGGEGGKWGGGTERPGFPPLDGKNSLVSGRLDTPCTSHKLPHLKTEPIKKTIWQSVWAQNNSPTSTKRGRPGLVCAILLDSFHQKLKRKFIPQSRADWGPFRTLARGGGKGALRDGRASQRMIGFAL